MRAFVTGGTGLVGRPIVHALFARGWDVTVLTRDPARAKDLEALGARIVRGDVTRPTFQGAMSGADVVFHAAGRTDLGGRERHRVFDVNLTGTRNVFSVARRESVERIVYTSTAGVFAPVSEARPATESSPVQVALDDPYVRSKVEAHQLAVGEMHTGLPVTIILAATKGDPGQMYLFGDRVLPIIEFYKKAAEVAGVRPPAANVPTGAARIVARFSEVRGRFSGRTPLLSRAALDLAAIDLVVDSTKARAELGWIPQLFEDRLRETVDWYRRKYGDLRAPLPIKPNGP